MQIMRLSGTGKGSACPPPPAGLVGSGPRSGFKMIVLYDISFSQNASDEILVTQDHACVSVCTYVSYT